MNKLVTILAMVVGICSGCGGSSSSSNTTSCATDSADGGTSETGCTDYTFTATATGSSDNVAAAIASANAVCTDATPAGTVSSSLCSHTNSLGGCRSTQTSTDGTVSYVLTVWIYPTATLTTTAQAMQVCSGTTGSTYVAP
jgi:hypothetical protein